MTTYHLYRNVGKPFYNYEQGDLLWFDAIPYDVADAMRGRDAEHALDGPVPPVLDDIFERHNRDDRPDGQRAPSLSIGDIIALDWPNEGARFFSVDSFGFTEVDGPMLKEVVNNDITLPASTSWSDAMDHGIATAHQR